MAIWILDLYHALARLHELCEELYGVASPWAGRMEQTWTGMVKHDQIGEVIAGDSYLIELRDLAYEVDRNFDLLLQDVRNAIEYKIARESEEQARLTKEALHASHRLNILAALFLPLTAITSVFGMNFAHGLDEGSPVLFWLVFVGGAGLGFAMKSWVLAKAKGNPSSAKP